MLVKYNPSRNLLGLNREVDRFFNSFLTKADHAEVENIVSPSMEVEETDNHFNISFELPGVEKDDLKIEMKEDVLTVSGEKKSQNVVNEKNYHYSERSFGKFKRAIEINSSVVNDKINAEFKNGVLFISLPKAEEAKPKQIEVKVK
jgi:HSP20 family protein